MPHCKYTLFHHETGKLSVGKWKIRNKYKKLNKENGWQAIAFTPRSRPPFLYPLPPSPPPHTPPDPSPPPYHFRNGICWPRLDEVSFICRKEQNPRAGSKRWKADLQLDVPLGTPITIIVLVGAKPGKRCV